MGVAPPSPCILMIFTGILNADPSLILSAFNSPCIRIQPYKVDTNLEDMDMSYSNVRVIAGGEG